ncbi:MAG: GAF domain-containing protein, partial [FCB group bacterium]
KEGKLILINSEFLRLFGYKDYTELIGKNFKEVVAPNERDCYIDYLNNDLNRLKFPVLFESQGIKKDGTLFDISSYTTNFQIENESYCIIYIADITNRNIEKQDILKSEMRLEVLLSIAQFDPKSKEEFLDYALHEALILTSSKFGHIYFYDENKEEFSLHSWSDKVMEECNIVYPKTTCKLKDTGLWGEPVRQRAPVIINEYRKPHHLKRGYPEGHAIIERFLSVPVIYNDRIQAVIGVANKDEAYDDSDARQLTLLMDSVWKYIQIKDTEIAMFEYEKRYHTLFDNMTEGFALCRMIFDDKGFPDDFEYIEVNKSFEKITKLKNVVGKKVTDVIPDIKKLNPELLEIFNRVSMTGIPEKFEIELKPLSMWLSFSAYSSNKEYFVTVFDNITDRKLAEERIIHLNENLEHEVMNRTAELSDAFMKLKDANEELQVLNENIAKESTKLVMLNEKLAVSEQKLILSNQTKDKFFSIIAHDLINPFQGLLLSTELLTRYVNMNDFEKMKGKALQIHEISKHITELLENLLTWSRAQKDSLEFNPEITEISSMVDNCIEIFQENILQKNINVIHRKDPLLTALLDKNLIKTVIRNLISNAIKFSENGSEIIITYFEVGKFIVLSVRDYGIGISSEDIQKLFKIETSNRSIGKSKEKGTGLGLILCKEFVELHGGEIWVDSALGKGCKFYCILPKEQ